MGTDADSSRRKHRRSSSNEEDRRIEAEKSSKRRRSKKHDADAEESSSVAASASLPPLPPPPPPPSVPLSSGGRAVDDDVEEGEILEEDEKGGLENPEVNAEESKDRLLDISFEVDKFDNKIDENDHRNGQEGNMNGHDHGYSKEYKKRHRESKEGDKWNMDHIGEVTKGDNGKLTHRSKSSPFETGGAKVAIIECSPHDNYYDEVQTRSKSVSKDLGRERSRSRSLTVEDAPSNGRRCHDKGNTDLDHDRMTELSKDLRYGGRDVVRGAEREHGTSYRRSLRGENKHERQNDENRSRKNEENGIWENEVDRKMRREKDRERARDRDIEREWRRDKDHERTRDEEVSRDRRLKDREKSRDVDVDITRRRDVERGGSRDRTMDMDRDIEREWRRDKDHERTRDEEVSRDRRLKDREKSRDVDVDRTRRRDVERGGSRDRTMDMDRDIEREWRRDMERGRSRDRGADVERRVERSRGRSRDRDKYGSKSRMELGKNQENERDGVSERNRDRERERERDRHRERERGRDYSRGNEKGKQHDESRGRDRGTRSDLSKLHDYDNGLLDGVRDKLQRDEDEQDDFEERIELKLAEEEEEDVERIKEESRKRRQAILQKFENLHQKSSQSEEAKQDKEPAEGIDQSRTAATIVPESLEDKSEDGDAFDTDPNFFVKKSPAPNGLQVSERISGPVGLGEGTPKNERLDEKYCDDIFGETPTRVTRLTKGEALPIHNSGINDNWDDADGYYSYRFGEILDGRYEISAAHGKGVFSAVVRAKDLKAGDGEPEEVAIKIIRNNDTMNKAGKTEVEILQKLAAADPENKRHCVRFLSSFKYKNHLCLVFESLHMNLREVLKKFGRNIGLRLTAVRTYSKQLFIALKHLRTCGILHCDIKPDNMLVNEAKNVLKLCDFGNAMYSGRNDVTPYLVSRFYRAPEIILGLPYDHPMDVWSVGCCLYELYTGKVLFPGPSNNDMLRLHMELKGSFPKKMLKKGAFADQHFDSDLNFHSVEEDPVSKKTLKKLLQNIKPKDVGSIISSYPGEDPKMLANFKDLLDKIFVLDPDKRLTVSQALAHPFITGK